MIFDVLLVNGRSVLRESLLSRLTYAQNEVVRPFQRVYGEENLLAPSSPPPYPFEVSVKKMWKPYGIAEILQKEIPQLRHENDGLIFTPVADPYQAGTCERLLKWKPSELNTVDFKLSIDRDRPAEEQYALLVGTRGGEHRRFALHRPDKALDSLDGQIVECRCVPHAEGGGGAPTWQFVRVRADKIMANNERVVEKIISSIRDNVTSEELIARIPAIHRAWKAREAAARAQPSRPVEAPSSKRARTE